MSINLDALFDEWDAQADQSRWRGSEIATIIRHMEWENPIGAEVGVFCGTLSAYLLREIPDLKLYMVDRWMPCGDSSYAESGDLLAHLTVDQWKKVRERAETVTDFADDRRKICQGDSRGAWNFQSQFDFVFIDAAHDYENCLADIRYWAGRVRPGGIVMGHDWGTPAPDFEVERAVKQYAKETGVTIELGADWFWAFQKPE